MTMTEIDNEKLFEIRKQIVFDQARLMDEASFGMQKWFSTSLFLLNAGALATSVGIQEARTAVASSAGIGFSLGIASSLIAGLLLGRSFSSNTWELFEKAWNGQVFELESVFEFASKRAGNRLYYASMAGLALSAGCLIWGAFQVSLVLQQGA